MEPSVIMRGLGPMWQWEVTWAPGMVKGGDETYVFRESFGLDFGRKIVPVSIGSFLGVDTGDIVEAHAEVIDPSRSLRLYARSLHKETTGIYDAWDWQRPLGSTVTGKVIVSVLCRVTGRNWWVFTKRLNPLTAIFHPAVVIGGSE